VFAAGSGRLSGGLISCTFYAENFLDLFPMLIQRAKFGIYADLSYRTIVGHRQGDRLIFVHGFAKNEADNITKKEKEALRKLCDVYMRADDKKLAEVIEMKQMLEIQCHEQNS
jgi:hypothetical protein